MTSPACYFLLPLCSNSYCASRGSLTLARSLASLAISWKALDKQAGLEGSDVSGHIAPQACEMLSAVIWRPIRETYPAVQRDLSPLLTQLSSCNFHFFLSYCLPFSRSPFSFIWTMRMLTLMLGDLGCDFRLRLFSSALPCTALWTHEARNDNY